MVYKKYIKRNGKLYGPYVYESKRIDGKVVSEYHGSEELKPQKGVKVRDYKKIFFVFIGLFLLLFLVYFFIRIPLKDNISGNVIANFESSYTEGESLEGVLDFSLNEGELIPASSKVIFENSGIVREFTLSEVFEEPFSDGKYYINEMDLEGEGAGYGFEGERVVYPEVNFILKIYKEVVEDEEVITEEEISDENSLEEEIVEEVTEEISEEQTDEIKSAPITGDSVRNSGGGFFSSLFGITGNVVSMELQEEIQGTVSKDKPFIYDLKEGEKAELEPKSVQVGNKELQDKEVSLNFEENKLIITTDYSEIEKGYGKEYFGDKEKKISFDLNDLNLNFQEGDLNIKLFYENKEILSLTTVLEDGVKNSEEIIEIPKELEETEEVQEDTLEIPEETFSFIKDISDSLSLEERNILLDKFGEASLKTISSEIFKDRIIIKYEIGEYNIEYSYDSTLEEDFLNTQMELDRIKFLKDVANSILKEKDSSENLTGFRESYDF